MRVSQIKRGVRVRVIKLLEEDVRNGISAGQMGTVLDESSMPWVQLDNYTMGHSKGNPSVPNSVRVMYSYQIALVREETAQGSKAPKSTWSPKSISIPPKATKADLAKLLQETVDQLNEVGAKLVKAQNTITSLKKKAAK